MNERRIQFVLKMLQEARETLDTDKVESEDERRRVLRVLLRQAELALLYPDRYLSPASDQK